MTEHDDLFEFDEFDDDESLELDLDDLFSDLEILALDPDAAAPTAVAEPPAAPAAEPVAATPEPTPAPTPAPEPAPAPRAPAAAPAPAAEAPQPQVAYAPPGAVPAGMPYVLAPQPPAGRVNKTTIAIGIAAIVTLANVAVIAAPLFKNEAPQSSPTIQPVTAQAEVPTEANLDPALLARIDELEARLAAVNTPPEAIPSDHSERHRAFDEIDNNIAAGDFVAARQRLYSLLAIIDRFPTHERDRTEELASYMLADTYRLEAQRELESIQGGRQ